MDIEESVPHSNRRQMLAGFALGGAAIVGGIAGAGVASSVSGAFRRESLALDVACLGRTWRDSPVRNPADGADFRAPFLVEGLIYPGGTVPESGFVPTPDGSIGRWFCRGWLILDAGRAEPHALTHQEFVFGSINEAELFPPDTLSSSGLEGTFVTQQGAARSIVGGTGRYVGATGQVVQTPNGFNGTVIDDGTGENAPNFIETFELITPDI